MCVEVIFFFWSWTRASIDECVTLLRDRDRQAENEQKQQQKNGVGPQRCSQNKKKGGGERQQGVTRNCGGQDVVLHRPFSYIVMHLVNGAERCRAAAAPLSPTSSGKAVKTQKGPHKGCHLHRKKMGESWAGQ